MSTDSRQPQLHPTHWLPKNNDEEDVVDALCLGTGRFLRSVLVPSLVGAGLKPALIQPRGRSFLEYMASRDGKNTYPVDTVLTDGTVQTEEIPCWGAFSLGSEADKEALVEWLPTLKQNPLVLGVGVTEAGLSSHKTQVMQDLYEILLLFLVLSNEGKWKLRERICVINTDNVPDNGCLIQSFMLRIAEERLRGGKSDFIHGDMYNFLVGNRIVFLDSMLDRITSQREGSNGMVPRCEPMPKKALVLLDPDNDLPPRLKDQPGVVVRNSEQQLETDIALKLRVANGTHTAIAHSLALQQHFQTTILSTNKPGKLCLDYLESLIRHQIIPAATASARATTEEAQEVWEDWVKRLEHPHFGLSTLFITQNGAAKGGIRWGPTILDLLKLRKGDENSPVDITVSTAFAYAALLRWLTPLSKLSVDSVFKGWFDTFDPKKVLTKIQDGEDSTEYAQGLYYIAQSGWYDFRCSLDVFTANLVSVTLPDLLFECRGQQPTGCVNAVRAYLLAEQGGNLGSVASNPRFESLVKGIATLYSRMLAGDGLEKILEELSVIGFDRSCDLLADGAMTISDSSNARFSSGVALMYQRSSIPDDSHVLDLPLGVNNARATLFGEVAAAEVIDLHTHILPPTHGSLCLWGIDELLTYHYLVAEYFMTAEASMTPEGFYAMSTQEQADIIWKALFIDRSPISEACRGVITTLKSLGLEDKVVKRDLQGIRDFYLSFQKRGEAGAIDFCEKVFQISGVRYAIMTNIPFSQTEAQYWRGPNKQAHSQRFRSALRVDPLLAGHTKTIEAALKGSGYEVSLEGARQYLRDWIDTVKPEYLMASTPHDFVFEEGSLAGVSKKGSVNKEALHEPFAFARAQQAATCNGTEDDAPSIVDENSDLLGEVLMKVCEERDLPVALKIGAHRGVNPRLKDAGDGVVAFADAGMLGRLCTKFPNVRFLATFLSRSNQHEAVVLATKFRNLHLYGCWWFCNNPSIIREITSMRIEMLGTAFTAQHSDARVVDQLLYKWPHSRGVIASVMSGEVEKMVLSGWIPTRREIRRDVRRLFGRSYEEFMEKSFAK